jgi:very-short-patch-repair endonuclease
MPSKGERKIIKLLKFHHLRFQHDKCFEKFVEETNRRLRFDFIVSKFVDNNFKFMFLEFDGKQHYQPVCFGGCTPEQAQKNFEKQQQHDKLKEKWCEENNYPLLRVRYDEIDHLEDKIFSFLKQNSFL